MIPKRLLVTHAAERTLVPKLKYCLARMKEIHPGWEFLFFSDGDCRDFVATECPEYEELYEWYPRAVMRADLFRLLAVHRLGGFYLDTDFLVEAALDPLVEHAAVFAVEQELETRVFRERYPQWMWEVESKRTLANYAFGAEAGHPFIEAILDELVARTENFEAEDCRDLDVLHATGPEAVTTAYCRQRERWDNVVILSETGSRFGKYGQHLVHSIWRTRE